MRDLMKNESLENPARKSADACVCREWWQIVTRNGEYIRGRCAGDRIVPIHHDPGRQALCEGWQFVRIRSHLWSQRWRFPSRSVICFQTFFWGNLSLLWSCHYKTRHLRHGECWTNNSWDFLRRRHHRSGRAEVRPFPLRIHKNRGRIMREQTMGFWKKREFLELECKKKIHRSDLHFGLSFVYIYHTNSLWSFIQNQNDMPIRVLSFI